MKKIFTGVTVSKDATVREIGQEAAEQAVVQTALAFYYHNPCCQYNLEIPITKSGDKFIRRETAPEEASRETQHYEDCRGLVSDIYWNAFHMIIPGTRFTWHPILNTSGREMIVLQYGDENGIKPYRDFEKFRSDFFKMIRPGDVLMSDSPTSSHIMLYLGACLGDGKRYVIHDWPVGGGTMNQETGENKYEPNGSATLETVEEIWYPGNGTPSWNFGRCDRFWLFRPLRREAALNATLPLPTISRLRYPYLSIKKESTPSIYGTARRYGFIFFKTTIENRGPVDYRGIPVKEYVTDNAILDPSSIRVNGRKAGEARALDHKPAVFWTIDLPAGSRAELSYAVKPKKAAVGKTLVIPAGFVDEIPTREMHFRVSENGLDKEQVKTVKALKKGALPESIAPKSFKDADYVNLFYKKILGINPDLPKKTEDWIRTLFRVEDVLSENAPGSFVKMLVLPEKEERTAAAEALFHKTVNRFIGGKCVALPDRKMRAFDYLEEYFTVGDCFLIAGGENELSVTDKSALSVYVYIGGNTVIAHEKAGTKRMKFSETVSRALIKNIVLGIRPTL